jgi:benzylsuccinate CoA-transferase BbsF subunit
MGEDRWVAIAVQDDEQWRALGGLMGRPDLLGQAALASAPGRVARRAELDEAVAAWTSGLGAADAESRCQAAGIAAHQVQSSVECLADPQLIEQGHVVELEHPHRRCLVEAPRFRLSRTPGQPQARAPFLGEHTFEVLNGFLGYDVDRVADLAAAEALE